MKEKQATQKTISDKQSPRNYIIAGMVIVIVFFGGLGAMSAIFPFGGAVIAPGTVKISMERKTIQHLEGGLVDEILVREGDLVKKGQVLVRLKSSSVAASVSIIQGQLWAKSAQLARLKAESIFSDSIEWPELLTDAENNPTLKKILREEENIFKSKRKDIFGKAELYDSQIEQMNEKIIGAREEMKAEKKIIETLREELDAKKELYEGRYIDKAQLLALERSVAEREGRVASLRQAIAETRQVIEGLKLRIVDLRNTYQQNASSELSSVSDAVFELKEKLKAGLDQQNRLEIRAPVTGTVINMMVHSEDAGVIRSGEKIMEIVPEDAKLLIESKVQTQNITKVKKGQGATVQLTAFNRRDTKPIEGIVTYISADMLTQRTGAGEIPFYIVRVDVDEKALKENGAYLSPGMPAVCYIKTKERTLLRYLLDPLLQNLDMALRESD